jgi:two-component system chemotaxis response regulator CheY
VVVIKILVVDDQETMRKVISHILSQLGFTNVKTAVDGRVAFRMLVQGDFDFVISDWNMPNMTGIQLLKAIRLTEKIKKMPVLLVTAENEKKQVMEAVKAGVNSFICKPFSAAELQKKIGIIFPSLQLS